MRLLKGSLCLLILLSFCACAKKTKKNPVPPAITTNENPSQIDADQLAEASARYGGSFESSGSSKTVLSIGSIKLKSKKVSLSASKTVADAVKNSLSSLEHVEFKQPGSGQKAKYLVEALVHSNQGKDQQTVVMIMLKDKADGKVKAVVSGRHKDTSLAAQAASQRLANKLRSM